jgi:hypothetical protein
MIWWLWTAFRPVLVHTFDVNAAWRWCDEVGGTDLENDLSWLGEGAWTARGDNMGFGLR